MASFSRRSLATSFCTGAPADAGGSSRGAVSCTRLQLGLDAALLVELYLEARLAALKLVEAVRKLRRSVWGGRQRPNMCGATQSALCLAFRRSVSAASLRASTCSL